MFLPLGDDVDKRTMPIVGTFLIAMNVLIFAYEMRLAAESAPAREYEPPEALMELVQQWGMIPKEFLEGKMIVAFTYMFLHGDLTHLLGNMLVLWAFVHTLEGALGQMSFMFFYIMWGVVAAVFHAFMMPESEIPMIGASGAIAGMIGAYFIAYGAMTKIKCLFFFGFRPWRVEIPAGAFVGLWVISQLIGLAGETEDHTAGVAWYCHLGGFAAGALTMLIAGNADRKVARNRHGELEIVEAGYVERLPGEPAAESKQEFLECQYCGTPFTHESKIAPTLLKCPNSLCDRLTYIS